MSEYDVVIIGGGPAGLAAALTLGRARRNVLLCDAGAPRNAAATHIHNFVTRDGTPPAQFRQVGRSQLAAYPSVEVQDVRVTSIEGERDAFQITTGAGAVRARRVLLCVGMVDESIELPGFAEAWGQSVFQCPYCHGWEVRDRRWGYLATSMEGIEFGFPALLRGWTEYVTVFTPGTPELSGEVAETLAGHGVGCEARPVARLIHDGGALTHVELVDGARVPCEVLYAHPPQRQVDLVAGLGLELDPQGFVQADPMSRATSVPGIYAAGDLTTRAQGAIFAAATGAQAGAMINHELCLGR